MRKKSIKKNIKKPPSKIPSSLNNFKKLLQIVSRLRGPKGCPWDKAQTNKSLTSYIIEEAYELVQAIENENRVNDFEIIDELGDFLFQVILQAQVASDENRFNIDDVIKNINLKLIRRHPHVFEKKFKKTTDFKTIWKNWEKTKRLENPKQNKIFNFPLALPALQIASKIGRKCQTYKFDWTTAEQVFEKVLEEIDELQLELKNKNRKNKISKEKLSHEIGDVLFSVAQLARHLDLDPEQCLRSANNRFTDRFQGMLDIKKISAQEFTDLKNIEKENLWKAVKKIKK